MTTSPKGRVYLVGAGPGDPGLITLAGIQALEKADVVLYDYLANPSILEHASPMARLICMGRHGQGKLWTQDEINKALVAYALDGFNVVRLKGGDPAIFARTVEELETLTNHDIPFETVSGITAALAASSFAGIPVTHRDMASAVAFVTGQQRAGKQGELDYDALARFPGTLVFYMGVTTAEEWTNALIESGKPTDTACAIIRRCSHPDQTVIRCTLCEVPHRLHYPQLVRPPAIVIVGSVASLPTTYSWFEQRPLFGQSVLVTRPRHQASALADPLRALGAEVLMQPAMEIVPPTNKGPMDDAIRSLSSFDWIAFSSVNGVRHFLSRMLEQGLDWRQLAGVRLAAVGPTTVAELRQYHLHCDLVPDEFEATALADKLAPLVSAKRVLLPRADRGREILSQRLASAGADVTEVVAYESHDVLEADATIKERLAGGELNWVTVTSSATARSLVALFGDVLRNARLASLSPITSATLSELGYPPTVEATEYTMTGLIDAIAAFVAAN